MVEYGHSGVDRVRFVVCASCKPATGIVPGVQHLGIINHTAGYRAHPYLSAGLVV
ncbi:TPA: hypothetical protein ACQ301_004427 [Yersinia enterocolitica]